MSPAAIATSIGSKLLISGLQRGSSILFGKAIRVRRIDQALKGNEKNELVRTALNDYDTVIGQLHGEFTESVNNFHLELEKSGVLEGMVEAALMNIDTECIYESFQRLHAHHFKDGNSCRPMYDAMLKSFRTSMEALTKDRVIFDLVRLYSKRIVGRIEQIERAIDRSIQLDASDAFETVAPTIVKIARALQSSYKYIRLETNKGARDVDISKIYIAPRLHFRESAEYDTNVNLAAKIISTEIERHSPRGRSTHFLVDERDRVLDSIKDISYSDLKSNFRRVVILGDPGGGKSTLCQRLCFDMAKNASLALQHGEREEIPAHEQKIPIRIILRHFEKAKSVDPQVDLMTYICRDLRNYVSAEPEEIKAAVKYLLFSGRTVLAFDGIDEILETSRRRDFVDIVAAFCNQFPLCPVIVTSRFVGYDQARMPDEFEELLLTKFAPAETREYLNKFMVVVGEQSREESTIAANKFMNQTNNNATDLRSNPLMLGLMAWLFHRRGDVPSNRPEIYRDCATLMFERWDPDRGIIADLPEGFDRLQLFSALAAQIFPDPELRAGVEKAWLESSLRTYFSDQFESKAKAGAAAISLVKFLTGRAWVMTDVGDRVFAFTHQTFLEYFFARHLDDSSDTVDSLLRIIRPKILKKEWDVVAHLSLQLKTDRNNRKQEEAISGLLRILELTRYNKHRASITSFLAASLEYLSPNEQSVRVVIDKIYHEVIQNYDPRKPETLESVRVAIESGARRRTFVDETIKQLLLADLNGADEGRRDKVARIISDRNRKIYDPSAPRYRLHMIPEGIGVDVQAKARDVILRGASRDLKLSQLASYWFGVLSAEALDRFGVAEFCNPSAVSRLNPIETICLASSPAYTENFGGPLMAKSDLENSLRVLGAYGLSHPAERSADIKGRMDIPLFVWAGLLKEREAEPELFMGLLFSVCIMRNSGKADREVHVIKKIGRMARRVARDFPGADAERHVTVEVVDAYLDLLASSRGSNSLAVSAKPAAPLPA